MPYHCCPVDPIPEDRSQNFLPRRYSIATSHNDLLFRFTELRRDLEVGRFNYPDMAATIIDPALLELNAVDRVMRTGIAPPVDDWKRMRHLVGVLLHEPSVRARELAREGEPERFIDGVQALFGLEVERHGWAPFDDFCVNPLFGQRAAFERGGDRFGHASEPTPHSLRIRSRSLTFWPRASGSGSGRCDWIV